MDFKGSHFEKETIRFCCKVSFSEVLGYCLSLRVAVGR